jgi:CcmD family protein
MDDATTITTAVKAAFAAVNALIWTGLFLYLLRLGRKVRELEARWTSPADRKAGTP